MILETLRLWTDALDSDDYGVNPKLAELSLYPDDDFPDAIEEIVDPTRDQRCAEWEDPINVPAIYVTQESPALLEGEISTAQRDGTDVPVAVWYIGRSTKADEATAEALYVFRAILRTLEDFMSNAKADDREKNDIQIVSAKSVTWGLVAEPLGSTAATGALIVTFYVRDNSP